MSDHTENSYIDQFYEKKIPGFVGICYQCNFYSERYSELNVKNLIGENLHESLVKAVVKRKSEFVAGRYLARQALISLGSKNTSVAIGDNREPLWPSSFTGSISHTEQFAICAIAHKNNVKRIGIDVENLIDIKTAKDILDVALVESEKKYLDKSTINKSILITVIFSAKESLFKALYPEVGRYFDFSVAETKKIDFEKGLFTLELLQELAPDLPTGTLFNGAIEINNKRIITIIYEMH